MVKYSIEIMQEKAKSKGGLFLSEVYLNSTINHDWQCSKGHKWSAKPSNIFQGGWCPKCCNKKPCKYKLSDAKNYAIAKKGSCLSTHYKKVVDRLIWQCEEGHIWEAVFGEVKKGSWCPECAWQKRRCSIEECNQIAAKNFGKCLSKKCLGIKSKLLWKCEIGHIWKATLGNIKFNNSWCPDCCQSYGEQKFREILEKYTGKPFKRIRPNWLLNNNGNRMEIDGYNQELNIGFEFQGKQHFEFVKLWHKEKDKFKKQLIADEQKKNILKLRKVKMLYPSYKLKPESFLNFIKENLMEFK